MFLIIKNKDIDNQFLCIRFFYCNVANTTLSMFNFFSCSTSLSITNVFSKYQTVSEDDLRNLFKINSNAESLACGKALIYNI